jgi:hypothetical protein
MKKNLMVFCLFVIVFFIGKCCGNPNSKVIYGEESGLPKNCRAIIAANIDGWRSRAYSAEDVLDSIERNCGRYGYSWE